MKADEEKQGTVSPGGSCKDGLEDNRSTKLAGSDIESAWFWQPHTLRFNDKLERTYHRTFQESSVGTDSLAYFLGCLRAPMLLVAMWGTATPSLLRLTMSLVLPLAPPVLLYLSTQRRQWYREHRDSIVLPVHIALLVVLLWSTQSMALPDPTPLNAVVYILTKSPIGANLLFVISLRLRFWPHVLVQGCMAIILTMWPSAFCTACAMSGKDHGSIFHALGGFIYNVHPVSFLSKLQASGEPPSCWLVSFFLLVVLGFLVPITLLYILEISWRANFLEPRITQHEVASLREYQKKGVEFAMWMLLMAMQLTWVLFWSLSGNY